MPVPPEQLCPINTEISAAPPAKSSGTSAAAMIRIRVVRLRVRTGMTTAHPPSTALASHPGASLLQRDPQRVSGDPTVLDQRGREHHRGCLTGHRERDDSGMAALLGRRDLGPPAYELQTQAGCDGWSQLVERPYGAPGLAQA